MSGVKRTAELSGRAASPSWLNAGTRGDSPPAPRVDSRLQGLEAGIERIREEARRMAQADAASDMPAPDAEGPTESERELENRCLAFLERWQAGARRTLHREVSEREEQVSETLGRIALGIDRFERVTNELIRLKVRFGARRRELAEELSTESRQRARGLPTPLYLSALVFLGLVEFFANAPVFNALLPRDPLSERQIQLLNETSEGWLTGIERVGAQLLFRPDAALLAAGVITFLCVLAHFFGHALRDLVMQGGRGARQHTVHSRSARENAVPIVLSGLGLVLTLGVLYEARITLGDVGQERYVQDLAEVEELRRQAGWLRVDGEILQANQLTNRADDMEEVATELREYSISMARMNLPILLLNLTLVLCAISAAYFHRRDGNREHMNEAPFEEERRAFVEQGEGCARETAGLLADAVRDIRALRSLALDEPEEGRRSVIHELESVFATYRAENGRARKMDPGAVRAFRTPMRIGIDEAATRNGAATARAPDEYERERADLAARFNDVRTAFNREATATW